MTARRVLLLRHGRTGHNQNGIWQGQLDVPLDDVGRAQAKAAAVALAAELPPSPEPSAEDGGPVAIVSSDLSRARDTAAAVAEHLGLPVTFDERLRETYAGRWQGLTRAQIAANGWAAEFEAWRRGDDVPAGGGERRTEVGLRGAQAVHEHAQTLDGGTLVVVAHGGVLRGTVLTLLGLEPGRWGLLGGLANCEWGRMAPAEPVWRLLGYALHA